MKYDKEDEGRGGNWVRGERGMSLKGREVSMTTRIKIEVGVSGEGKEG